MTRWIAVLAMAPTPAAAFARFAGESRSPFPGDRAEPRAWNGPTILEFATADAEEGGSSGARSVEEIRRGPPEAERAGRAIRIGVELSRDRATA